MDIWQCIRLKEIPIPSLYFAHRRDVVWREGMWLEGHDFYFTLGANIGAADCPIPTSGIAWRHTRPPVVLED